MPKKDDILGELNHVDIVDVFNKFILQGSEFRGLSGAGDRHVISPVCEHFQALP